MTFLRKLKHLLPWVRRAADRDMQEELAALEAIAGRQQLGNLTIAAEDARAAESWLWLERLTQDVRYASRSMRHNKSFSALVILSLALGIGANTVIYSFMEAILIRPLPVSDPASVVILKWRAKTYSLVSEVSWSTGGSWRDPASGTISSVFPYAALKVFEDSTDVVATTFGYFATNRLAVTSAGETDSVRGQYVSGRYFDGIGVVPIAGRLIQPADDHIGSASVAVISQRFSRARFGAPEAAVGQTIRINDNPFQIIGVSPSAFFGAEPGSIPDVYIPLHADSVLESPRASEKYGDDRAYWIEIMARLKPGTTLTEAQMVLEPRFHQFVESTATTDEQRSDLPVLAVQPGATGLDTLRRQYSRPIFVLMAMVASILLIACSNIANLLLSRSAARRREIAVRLGIGASRARIIRQLLTESVLLSLLGGAAGLLIAWWGIGVLTELLSNGRSNFTLHAELNLPVFAVTLGLSVLTGLLFGLAPAIQATRLDLVPALKEVRASHNVRRWLGLSVGQTLVVLQVVLSLVLLVAAGLFGRTLSRLHGIELGFDRENVLLFTIRPTTAGYRGPDLFRVFDDIRSRLRGVNGVREVSLSTVAFPMGGGTMGPVSFVGAEPRTDADGRPARAVYATVGPTFFSTMRMEMIAGRDFAEGDNSSSPRVVVINQRLARLFGIVDPVGRTLIHERTEYRVIGVVRDALAFTLKEELRPVVYFPYLQSARPPAQMTYEVRTEGNPWNVAGSVRQVLREVDARLALHDIKTQAAHIDQAISTEITLARLCAGFGVLALVIACVGVYGTVAFNVARRTNEIGIRMTLGAQRNGIAWMVLREVLIMTAVGLAVGVPLALAGSQYVKTLLYGVEPNDPVSVTIAIVALLACGVFAGAIPALRASRIDPLAAVRHE